MTETLRIGELATRTSCPVETIRYYEREGLLPAAYRSKNNYRLYEAAHIERLAFIRHCRSLDMMLEEIRTLLRFRDSPQANCQGANQLLDQHIGHVAKRIEELTLLARQLKALRRQCTGTKAAQDCGILKELGRRKPRATRSIESIHGHVPGTHRPRLS